MNRNVATPGPEEPRTSYRIGAPARSAYSARRGASATFWVHADHDGYATVGVDRTGRGTARVDVNGQPGFTLGGRDTASLFLSAGLNRLTVTGATGELRLDRVRTAPSPVPGPARVEAESGVLTGAAQRSAGFSFASGQVVTAVGDGPGNARSCRTGTGRPTTSSASARSTPRTSTTSRSHRSRPADLGRLRVSGFRTVGNPEPGGSTEPAETPMSPIDHLIVTVIGSRRAKAREPRSAPAPDGRRQPQPPAGPRPAKSGTS